MCEFTGNFDVRWSIPHTNMHINQFCIWKEGILGFTWCKRAHVERVRTCTNGTRVQAVEQLIINLLSILWVCFYLPLLPRWTTPACFSKPSRQDRTQLFRPNGGWRWRAEDEREREREHKKKKKGILLFDTVKHWRAYYRVLWFNWMCSRIFPVLKKVSCS